MSAARAASVLIRLALNLVWFVSGAGAVLLAASVVLVFLTLRLVLWLLWWVFNLPGKLLEGRWSKS